MLDPPPGSFPRRRLTAASIFGICVTLAIAYARNRGATVFAEDGDAGAITGWNIWLRESGAADPQHSLETRSANDLAGVLSPNNACGAGALNPFASTVAQPGVWSGGPRVVVVPTASEIGLVLLTALLAACAVWRLRF